jgi:hypothetical protein
MNRTGKTRSVYFFKNTCHNCDNDIEFPLLGNFADYEFLMQTIDGRDFCIGVIVDNPTFDFVDNNLQSKELADFERATTIRQILRLLADKMHNKEFSKSYPICPVCQKLQTSYNDDVRTVVRDLNYASWNDFDKLSLDGKLIRLNEVYAL